MIYLASDHAGFELKKAIAVFLTDSEIEYRDFGPDEYDETDDYPDYIIPAAQKVGMDPNRNKAIVIGGSGQGEMIAANKVRGVRAVLYYGGPKEIITLSRTHNNANVLSLGARFLTTDEAIITVKLWLSTDYPGDKRHESRINKIKYYENN
jgi:ribose 5-phosphate isomerase B